MRSLTAVIYAKDSACVAGFYRDLLSLSVVDERAGDFVCLQSADQSLELSVVAVPYGIADGISIEDPPQELRRARRSNSASLWTTLTRPEAALQSWAGASTFGTQNGRWRGMTHCDGRDPEGNVFQLRAAVPVPTDVP